MPCNLLGKMNVLCGVFRQMPGRKAMHHTCGQTLPREKPGFTGDLLIHVKSFGVFFG